MLHAPSPTGEPVPLVIASVAAAPATGWLSIGPCPGRADEKRNLARDLAAIRATGVTILITLMTRDELDELGVGDLQAESRRIGLIRHHLPIRDFGTPDARWEEAWQLVSPGLRAALRQGSGIHLHCRGGCGRSGMVAARILAELGVAPGAAIARVRAARPCAIETAEQENVVRGAKPAI